MHIKTRMDLGPFVDCARQYAALPHRGILASPFIQRHILSYGLAVCARDTKRWMMVKTAFTPNLAVLLRGFYRQADLDTILEHCSPEERATLSQAAEENQPESCFEALYHQFLGASKEADGAWTPAYVFGYARFMASWAVITALLPTLSPSLEQVGWQWPKGRRAKMAERTLDAAVREFEEETGLSSSLLLFPDDTLPPIRSHFRSNNGRIYETQLWLASVEKEVEVIAPRPGEEIAERKWMSTDEIKQVLEADPTTMSRSSHLALFHDVVRRAHGVFGW